MSGPQGDITITGAANEETGLFNSSDQGGGPAPGTITHTGSGFGVKSSLTPIFYQFFDNADIAEGALASTLGFTQGESSVTLTETDGLISGHGCATYGTVPGNADGFPHLHYVPASPHQRLIAMYHYKIERTSGTAGVGTSQMKGPRCSYDEEYNGTPRSTISFYHSHDCTELEYTNMGIITDLVNDGRDDAGDFPQGYKARFRANDFNLVEIDTDFGTVGNADGFIKPWHNGSRIGPFTGSGFDTDALEFRASSGELIEFPSIFPGLDGITPSDAYRVRITDYYIDNTPEIIVIGNASTWDACDDKIPLIPTSWANTSVTATMRKFPGVSPGGTVYSYVRNLAGTVSPGVAQVAI